MEDRLRFRFWMDDRYWYWKIGDCEQTPHDEGEQCTGLNDYNGQLIYEGDIGQHPDGSIFKVEWMHDRWVSRYRYLGQWSSLLLQVGEKGQAVIIGNIHENPELLEENN